MEEDRIVQEINSFIFVIDDGIIIWYILASLLILSIPYSFQIFELMLDVMKRNWLTFLLPINQISFSLLLCENKLWVGGTASLLWIKSSIYTCTPKKCYVTQCSSTTAAFLYQHRNTCYQTQCSTFHHAHINIEIKFRQ